LTIPLDLARHYPSDYYSQQPREEPAAPSGIKGALIRWYNISAALRPSSRWASWVRKALPVPSDFLSVSEYLLEARLHSSAERILDVGCGSSPYLLAAFHRSGFRAVEGVDPFIAQDCTYNGVPVWRKRIEDMHGPYGLVMFHHSLEHVPDPVATLRTAAGLLRPGGCCIVRIPVVDTYFWRTFGVDWAELDAPRHLYLMAVRTIEKLAGLTGFRVRKMTFESSGWELAASYQIRADVPMRDSQASLLGGPNKMFSAEQLRNFEIEAAALNQSGDGGRACFYLERMA
jgi:SAM-dependent methyltransferase